MAVGDELIVLGTPIVWTDSGGDEALDLGGLAATAVRVGAYHDWGVAPRAFMYALDIFIDGFDTAPVVNETVNIYITESLVGVTSFSGQESPADTSDGAGVAARLPNLLGPFPVVVWSTTAGNNLARAFEFRSPSRYMAPVVHNNTADALLSTADAHKITITPIYRQAQQS